MIKKLLEEEGLSLVEIIVSIGIIGILSVPIFGLLTINSRVTIESKNQIIATNLAENEIEELKSSKSLEIGGNTTHINGFIINSSIEIVERKDLDKNTQEKYSNNLYRLIVEVKKQGKVLEKLVTYRNSLKVGALYENL